VGVRGISIKEQVNKLNRSIREFIRCIESLPGALFLKEMNGWAIRDVTAHLIGWNIYTIKGCQQLRKGELPFYFLDPGDDFCKVNAVLVREYDSKDKKELIAQLDASLVKLKDFLITVGPADWETDFGVTYRGYTITIKNTIDNLARDYDNHRQQIEKWAAEEGVKGIITKGSAPDFFGIS
jgi:hypothetical protein